MTSITTTDALICGAGAIGLSIAYELATGGQRVLVLDRAHAGRQTSWAAGGILPPIGNDYLRDPFEQLRRRSYDLFPDWVQRIERDAKMQVEFDRCGGLHIAGGSGELAALAVTAAEWQREGVNVQNVTHHDWADLEPALIPAVDSGRIQAAYHLPDEAVVRTPRYLKALIAACRARQVQILENLELLAWNVDGQGGVTSVATTGGVIHPDTICLAAGSWSRELAGQFGIQLDIQPYRGQMLLLQSQPGLIRRIVNEGPNYLVPRRDGRILVGSTVEDVGFDLQTTREAVTGLRDFAVDLVPKLADAGIESEWAGLRPRAGDGWPYLGSVPGLANVFVAAGHFRDGIFLSPATAQIMTQIMTGESPDIDTKPFRLERK